MHHSNERPVGGAKSTGHAEEPVSAAGTALSPHYLLPPHACSHHKLLAPTTPGEKKRGKSVQNSPSTAYGFLIPVRKAGLPF
jgi:hypothetical protein